MRTQPKRPQPDTRVAPYLSQLTPNCSRKIRCPFGVIATARVPARRLIHPSSKLCAHIDCADAAGDVRASFTPVETGSTKDSRRALAAASDESVEVNADFSKKRNAPVGHQSTITCQFEVNALYHCVGKRDTETAGQMVVAGAPSAKPRLWDRRRAAVASSRDPTPPA